MTDTVAPRRRLQPATVALALAALIAVGVLAYTLVFRRDGNTSTVEANSLAANATAATGQAPSVEALMAGLVERIGDNRWRLVLPAPAYESMLDVIELVPAG